MKTLNIDQAAALLGAHKETVRRLAVMGIIPGAKIGRCWMFIEQDLVTHMRNKYSTCDASQGVHNRSNEIWRSKEKMVFGGLSSLTAENRIRKSTKTKVKADAQCFHDQLLEELWKTKKIRTVPKKTWVDAVVRWIDESSHKRSLDTDKFHLAWLDPYFRNKLLKDITEELIEKVAHEREKTGVKLSSVNRVLEVIRAILNRAHKEWKWLDSVPTIRMRKFENKRLRWLTQKEAQRLLDELPPHLKDMAAFTLATGLRESNVTGLQWSVVNLAKNHALIHSDQSKTKRAIPVPLNSLAQDIVAKQKGKHPIYVFTYQGEPVSRCNNHAWRKALIRAKIKDFRWHDLRHTWASWHVQSGTSLHELQQLGGWSDYDTVLRYAHLSSDHLQKAAERVSGTFSPLVLGS